MPSSIAAHTTNAWRPARDLAAGPDRTRPTRSRLGADGPRSIGQPPGRQLVEDRDVEVAVVGQRERPGIGVAVMISTSMSAPSLALQRHPLVQAEPVLLVDDREREIAERTDSWTSAWVPTTRSTPPSAMPSRIVVAVLAGDGGGEQREGECGLLGCPPRPTEQRPLVRPTRVARAPRGTDAPRRPAAARRPSGHAGRRAPRWAP